MNRKCIYAAVAAALFSVGNAQSAVVLDSEIVPQSDFNWSTGPDGNYGSGDDHNDVWGQTDLISGGNAAITADYPHNGNGSLVLSANGAASTKAGVAYYPPSPDGFGPLSSITAASFDWMRASGSAPTDESPAMRILLFTPGTDVHVTTLYWAASNDGITMVDDTWVTTDVLQGQVWVPTSTGVPALPRANRKTLASLQTDAAFKDLVVRGVEVGYGRSTEWGPSFVGAVDNVKFTAASASVDSNFEMTSYAVTITAPNGTATPASSTQLLAGQTLDIDFTPDTNYELVSVTGCGGTLAGTRFTTGAASANCTVTATFRQIGGPVVVTPVNAQSVPTLNEWGLSLLALITAGAAAVRLRRRNG